MKIYLATVSGIDLDTETFAFQSKPTKGKCLNAYLKYFFKEGVKATWDDVHFDKEDLEVEIKETELL